MFLRKNVFLSFGELLSPNLKYGCLISYKINLNLAHTMLIQLSIQTKIYQDEKHDYHDMI